MRFSEWKQAVGAGRRRRRRRAALRRWFDKLFAGSALGFLLFG